MARTPRLQHLKPIEDEAKLEAIIEAIAALTADDVLVGETANALDELSSRTTFEGIEANPDGVFTSDDAGTFEAACTIFVTLNYGGRNDAVSMTDSYPATIFGAVDENGHVSIDDIAVDTTSFFGPDQ